MNLIGLLIASFPRVARVTQHLQIIYQKHLNVVTRPRAGRHFAVMILDFVVRLDAVEREFVRRAAALAPAAKCLKQQHPHLVVVLALAAHGSLPQV
jgi:hypothetical protein